MSNSWTDEEAKRFEKAFARYIGSLLDSEAQEKSARQMFKKLENHIGEEVSYTGWWYGTSYDGNGELKAVNYFEGVEIGNMGLPFVGYGAAICEIISKDGEVLYENPFIEDN